MDNNVLEEFKVTRLIGSLVMITGDNVKYFLPIVRTQYSTLRSMQYKYTEMSFYKKLFGSFYIVQKKMVSRVIKELDDPTHPETTYPAAVEDRNKKTELELETELKYPQLTPAQRKAIVDSLHRMWKNQ